MDWYTKADLSTRMLLMISVWVPTISLQNQFERNWNLGGKNDSLWQYSI